MDSIWGEKNNGRIGIFYQCGFFFTLLEIFHSPTQEDQILSKNEKKNYFDAGEYVNRQLAIRTDQALQEKNKQFAVWSPMTWNSAPDMQTW